MLCTWAWSACGPLPVEELIREAGKWLVRELPAVAAKSEVCGSPTSKFIREQSMLHDVAARVWGVRDRP